MGRIAAMNWRSRARSKAAVPASPNCCTTKQGCALNAAIALGKIGKDAVPTLTKARRPG
jgi:hypothetical protein